MSSDAIRVVGHPPPRSLDDIYRRAVAQDRGARDARSRRAGSWVRFVPGAAGGKGVEGSCQIAQAQLASLTVLASGRRPRAACPGPSGGIRPVRFRSILFILPESGNEPIPETLFSK